MGWPQYTYLALALIGLGSTIAKHGQPRDPYSATEAVIAFAISFGLLWAGGFFGGGQ